MADASAAAAEAKPAVFVPPPKIEELFAQASGQMATVNRPVAGAKREEELPEGSAPIQLYSAGTPNGAKVAILLEELADAVGLEYDAFRINISQGAQFTSGFVKVNPNSKIPAIVDRQGPDGKPISIWESANIDLYLAEKYDKFIPKDPRAKNEMMTWIFWQMSAQGPISGACFGHFFVYAPDDKVAAREYGLARYGMEVQRLCSVLDQHLEGKTYMVGEEYTLADIMCFPWYNILKVFWKHPGTGLTANDFLSLDQYKNVNAWWERIAARPAVKRGLTVCSFQFPVAKPWLEPPKTEAS